MYDKASDALRARKFVAMWHGPYIVKRVLSKGSYELQDIDGGCLKEPRNGLYLKKYYAKALLVVPCCTFSLFCLGGLVFVL